ncbi:MAG: HlyD family type I secretion periplasmic adaptor subunit [Geminicoccaceae bacterium]|nr:HlyD family type I secretion periplasmic adaptor subunit [Geminicoccaceae bacterium]
MRKPIHDPVPSGVPGPIDTDTAVVIPENARHALEGRVSPVATALVVSVAALLTAGLGWSAWAEVEEVVQAQGRVEPSGRTKLINHAEGGRVATLHVVDGQRVERGDPLVTFALDIDRGRKAELQAQLDLREAEVARLQAEVENGEPTFPETLARERPELVAQQTELMRARAEALDARRHALDEGVRVRKTGGRELDADSERLRAGLELLRRQLASVRELARRGLYPKLKMQEIERQVIDTEGALARTDAGRAGAEAALAERKAERLRVDKEWTSRLLDELTEAMTARDRLRGELAAQTIVVDDRVVRAPVAGIVQDLAVTGSGQAIAANAPLMKLVPLDEGLIVKAAVANDDIGRIAPGMKASIKVRAYDFARFGTIDGEVVRIDPDSTAREPDAAPSYGMTVKALGSHVGDDARNALLPGMLVDVELAVGERTILSYFTEGITHYRNEAFREG